MDSDCVAVTDPMTHQAEHFEDGRPKGACLARPVGMNGPYAACGGMNGGCEAGLACLGFGADETSTCAPPCGMDGACPAPDGFMAQCILAVGDEMMATHCAIECQDTQGSTDCPAGMHCRMGGQTNFCAR
jgi:hypothetical protein